MDILSYGAIGYGVGFIGSLLFKKGPRFKYIGCGVGAGVALSMNDINLFKRQDLDKKAAGSESKFCLLSEKHLF